MEVSKIGGTCHVTRFQSLKTQIETFVLRYTHRVPGPKFPEVQYISPLYSDVL